MTSKGNPGVDRDEEQRGTNGHGVGNEDDPTLAGDGSWTQVEQSHFDPDEEGDLTTAVVTTIAAAENVHPTDLDSPPLYDVVDAPAIQQSLFGPERNGRCDTGSTEFRYDQYLVKVRSDGWIQVYE